MIEKNHPSLSVGAQCRLLSISRSSFYYEPQGETAMNLDLMLVIDKQFLETPFYGVRQMTWHLQNEGPCCELQAHPATDAAHAPDADLPEARYQQAREGAQDLPLSARRSAGGAAQSGLVRRHHLPARCAAASSIWSPSWTGITRKVLAWRISNTLEADFCVEALNEAIHKFGPPEIMNTDQGSQFTSFAWTDRLKRVGTRISMDGKGRCIDNIFIERLWRSLKYECVYLHAWETGSQARAGIGRWITFYNHQRPHTAHGGQPPAMVYFNRIETDQQVQAVA